MKKYILSGMLTLFAITAFAQPSYHGYKQQHRSAFNTEVREIYSVKVKKEDRNVYLVTQGVTGIYGKPIYLRTDACRIRHGTGSLRLNVDKRNPGMETGSLRINGVQCRVMSVQGFEHQNERPSYRSGYR